MNVSYLDVYLFNQYRDISSFQIMHPCCITCKYISYVQVGSQAVVCYPCELIFVLLVPCEIPGQSFHGSWCHCTLLGRRSPSVGSTGTQ